jgi:hypothetical protein
VAATALPPATQATPIWAIGGFPVFGICERSLFGARLSQLEPEPPSGGGELELIQTHMTQKPLLWVEVGAHAVRKRSECAGVVWAGAGVAWRLCVCCL